MEKTTFKNIMKICKIMLMIKKFIYKTNGQTST